MSSAELIKNIRDYCNANYSEANVIKYSYYFKGEHNAYGLTATQIHSKVKELLKIDKISFEVLLDAAPELIKSPKSEEITFLLLLLEGFGKQFTKPLLKVIESWYGISITNWAHADTLGMCILPQFLKYKIVDYTEFGSWLTSNHKFQRRSVPVTLIKLLKTNKTMNFSPVFDFIEPIMLDPKREVHQGVGWFLREAWKLNNMETEAFLLKWKNSAPRLIIQYATEKMSTDSKLRFKKSK